MSKFKYLLKNIGLLAISQFGTKLLIFFLVPLYTNTLSTSEYGIYDLFYSTINLLIPIITLNVADAVLRYSIDYDGNKSEVLTIGIKYALYGSIGATILVGVNHFVGLFQVIDEYWGFFPIMFFITIISTNFIYFCRGIDQVKKTAISGVICSVVLILSNILFLLVLKIGLIGYFIANILGPFFQSVYLFFSCKLWKFLRPVNNKYLEKEMRTYSAPLIANNIAWWINNSSDRFIVTLICGVAQNGIYSVAYKIPTILNIFQTIFSQAWTLSAVKDFDKEDKTGFFSKIYNIYNCIMVILCSGIIMIDRFLAKILYAKEFYYAWHYVPFLVISIVFGSLAGFLGGIFSAVKDSKVFAKSTVVGAMINIVLNCVLVYLLGTIGASIATLVSFWTVWSIRYEHVKKYVNLKINLKRDYTSYIILLLQAIILLAVSSEKLYIGEILLFLLIMYLYKDEVGNLIVKLKLKNRGIKK